MGGLFRRRAPKVIPFVGDMHLFAGRAMTTANIQYYVGLGELDVMGFLLHLLRPGDRFIDVGANIGAISVMAGGIGAEVVAIEPVPGTFDWLRRNVQLNKLGDRIECRNGAVGQSAGVVRMSEDQGATNRVDLREGGGTIECTCETLDHIVGERAVTAVKIDVEGFEVPVMRGGGAVWSQPSLMAVVVELVGNGNHYGFDENEVVTTLSAHGFEPCTYDALARRLIPIAEAVARPDNAIFVRDREGVQTRLAAAPRRHVIWDRQV